MARYERVQEAIREEVSLILHDALKDPRLGFVTVTRVEMTEDLRYAKIFFSVLGDDEEYRKTKEALDSALGFIRKLVAERINLRYAPDISFKEDRSTEYSLQIEKVLDEVKGLERSKDEPLPSVKVKAVKKTKKRKERRAKVKNVPKKSRRVRKKK